MDSIFIDKVMQIYDDLINVPGRMGGVYRNGFLRLSIGNNNSNGFVEILLFVISERNEGQYIRTQYKNELIVKTENNSLGTSNSIIRFEGKVPGTQVAAYTKLFRYKLMDKIYAPMLKINQVGGGTTFVCDIDYTFEHNN